MSSKRDRELSLFSCKCKAETNPALLCWKESVVNFVYMINATKDDVTSQFCNKKM